MRRRICYFLLALVMSVSSAEAQIGDWQDVEGISSNTPILVALEHQPLARCTFEYAIDSTLFCAKVYSSPYVEPIEVSFDRQEIRRVMVEDVREKNTAKGALIGAGIGAGIGAAIGAIPDPGPSGSGRLGCAVLFGFIGGVVGSAVGSSDRPTRRYRVIYGR